MINQHICYNITSDGIFFLGFLFFFLSLFLNAVFILKAIDLRDYKKTSCLQKKHRDYTVPYFCNEAKHLMAEHVFVE